LGGGPRPEHQRDRRHRDPQRRDERTNEIALISTWLRRRPGKWLPAVLQVDGVISDANALTIGATAFTGTTLLTNANTIRCADGERRTLELVGRLPRRA